MLKVITVQKYLQDKDSEQTTTKDNVSITTKGDKT
jgi:hypothetical protein